MKIVGTKNFYIEYSVIDSRTGYAKIWFDKNSIGTIEDIIFLKGYLLDGLEHIKNSYEADFETPQDKTDLYNLLNLRLQDNEPENTKYNVNFGTFCDDFTIFSFSKHDIIYIIWKLLSNKTPFKDLANESEEINFFKINKKEYITIFNQIEKTILQDLSNL